MTNEEAWSLCLQYLPYMNKKVGSFLYKNKLHSWRDDMLQELLIDTHACVMKGYLDRGSMFQVINYMLGHGKQKIIRKKAPITISLPVISYAKQVRLLLQQPTYNPPNLAGFPPTARTAQIIAVNARFKHNTEDVEPSTADKHNVTHHTARDLVSYLTAPDDTAMAAEAADRVFSLLHEYKDSCDLERDHKRIWNWLYVLARYFEIEERVFMEFPTLFTREQLYLPDEKDKDKEPIPQRLDPTLSSIGAELGISRERTRQLYNQVMQWLQSELQINNTS